MARPLPPAFAKRIREAAKKKGIVLKMPRQNGGISPERLPVVHAEPLIVETAPLRVVIRFASIPSNWANERTGHDIEKDKVSGQWREQVGLLALNAARRAGVELERDLTRPLGFRATAHPLRRVSITYYRCWPAFDWDGAVNASKPLVDGLRDGCLLHDDKLEDIHWDHPSQIRVAHKRDQMTEIELSELPPGSRKLELLLTPAEVERLLGLAGSDELLGARLRGQLGAG